MGGGGPYCQCVRVYVKTFFLYTYRLSRCKRYIFAENMAETTQTEVKTPDKIENLVQ